MKTKTLSTLFLLLLIMAACTNSKKFPKIEVSYPETAKEVVVDEYFGTKVEDPYRWLEDDMSEATADWVKRQNEVTFGYLEQIPFKASVRERLDEIANYERYSLPFKKKDKYYYYKNSGLQNQSVLYVANSKDEEGEVFLDPNTFSKDGTTSLGGLSFSENSEIVAYSISEGGSDWRKIIIMDAETKEILEDTIRDVKFSGINWNENDGFFYSSYDKPKEGSALSGINNNHKVYYHKIGTSQSDDKLVFGGEKVRRRYIGGFKFKDNDYLFMSASNGTSGSELYFRKGILGDGKFTQIIDNFDNDHNIVYAKDDVFYIITNLDAPNKRIVKVDANNPYPESWVDLIPEKEEVIESVNIAGENLFVEYLKDASSAIYQYDLSGNEIRKVELPGIGSAYGFNGEKEDTEVFFGFTSFTTPASMYTYQIESGEAKLYRAPKLKVDFTQFETEQVFYTSKDGTKVPMFIVHKKGIKLDGSNPTMLYGYGGFNISLTPSFSLRWLGWLDMGGVFALANLRGGGEYGEKWHKAGTKLQKQNVFDDFIAAAEYLQENGYTSKEKLTIKGGSNGGLLVGAVANQRPDLIQVALPAVGVMDMLRYHKFTAGAGWISDYGCADSSKAMFDYIYAYSPVHTVKENINYPATMVATADHDDRVVPAHSFKYISHLQDKQAGELPVLIKIDVKAGHGAGKSTTMFLDELADEYSFAFYNMNATPEYYTE